MSLFACLLATPAMAETPREAMFPNDGSCYLRQYSAEHLAAHPAQRVEWIAVGPDGPSWPEAQGAILRVRLQMRGREDAFLAYAYCEDTAEGMLCGLESDAGSFALTPRRGGKIVLQVGTFGMTLEGALGMAKLSGTAGDDREFLLPAVPADACP